MRGGAVKGDSMKHRGMERLRRGWRCFADAAAAHTRPRSGPSQSAGLFADCLFAQSLTMIRVHDCFVCFRLCGLDWRRGRTGRHAACSLTTGVSTMLVMRRAQFVSGFTSGAVRESYLSVPANESLRAATVTISAQQPGYFLWSTTQALPFRAFGSGAEFTSVVTLSNGHLRLQAPSTTAPTSNDYRDRQIPHHRPVDGRWRRRTAAVFTDFLRHDDFAAQLVLVADGKLSCWSKHERIGVDPDAGRIG